MAKRKLTQEQLTEEMEALVMQHMLEMEDKIAERFEIDCWDSCLDGRIWNLRMAGMAKMYTDAIVFDRSWLDRAVKKYKVKLTLDTPTV